MQQPYPNKDYSDFGICKLSVNRETREFLDLRISYSDEIYLSPGLEDAQILYQLIKAAFVEKIPVKEYWDFQRKILGATKSSALSTIQPIFDIEKSPVEIPQNYVSFQVTSGAITVFATPQKALKVYSDLRGACRKLSLDPDTLFSVP